MKKNKKELLKSKLKHGSSSLSFYSSLFIGLTFLICSLIYLSPHIISSSISSFSFSSFSSTSSSLSPSFPLSPLDAAVTQHWQPVIDWVLSEGGEFDTSRIIITASSSSSSSSASSSVPISASISAARPLSQRDLLGDPSELSAPIVLPKSLLLSAVSPRLLPATAALLRRHGCHPSLPDAARVCADDPAAWLAIAAEIAAGPRSFWWPYLRALTHHIHPLSDHSTPKMNLLKSATDEWTCGTVSASEAELLLLREAGADRALRWMGLERFRLESAWASSRAALSPLGVSFADFRLAAFLASSRSFQWPLHRLAAAAVLPPEADDWPQGVVALVPLLDLVNHDSAVEQNGYFWFNTGELEGVQAWPASPAQQRPVPAGTQLHNTYGTAKASGELFASYGFVEQSNRNDALVLRGHDGRTCCARPLSEIARFHGVKSLSTASRFPAWVYDFIPVLEATIQRLEKAISNSMLEEKEKEVSSTDLFDLFAEDVATSFFPFVVNHSGVRSPTLDFARKSLYFHQDLYSRLKSSSPSSNSPSPSSSSSSSELPNDFFQPTDTISHPILCRCPDPLGWSELATLYAPPHAPPSPSPLPAPLLLPEDRAMGRLFAPVALWLLQLGGRFDRRHLAIASSSPDTPHLPRIVAARPLHALDVSPFPSLLDAPVIIPGDAIFSDLSPLLRSSTQDALQQCCPSTFTSSSSSSSSSSFSCDDDQRLWIAVALEMAASKRSHWHPYLAALSSLYDSTSWWSAADSATDIELQSLQSLGASDVLQGVTSFRAQRDRAWLGCEARGFSWAAAGIDRAAFDKAAAIAHRQQISSALFAPHGIAFLPADRPRNVLIPIVDLFRPAFGRRLTAARYDVPHAWGLQFWTDLKASSMPNAIPAPAGTEFFFAAPDHWSSVPLFVAKGVTDPENPLDFLLITHEPQHRHCISLTTDSPTYPNWLSATSVAQRYEELQASLTVNAAQLRPPVLDYANSILRALQKLVHRLESRSTRNHARTHQCHPNGQFIALISVV